VYKQSIAYPAIKSLPAVRVKKRQFLHSLPDLGIFYRLISDEGSFRFGHKDHKLVKSNYQIVAQKNLKTEKRNEINRVTGRNVIIDTSQN
jgi:hypothetical protein